MYIVHHGAWVMTKDVMLTIRIPEDLRGRYQAAIKRNDDTASRHLREVISAYCDAAEAEFGATIAESEQFERWTGRGTDYVLCKVRAKKAERRSARPTLEVIEWNNYTNEDASSRIIGFLGPEAALVEWVHRIDNLPGGEAFDLVGKLGDIVASRHQTAEEESQRQRYDAEPKALTIEDLPPILRRSVAPESE